MSQKILGIFENVAPLKNLLSVKVLDGETVDIDFQNIDVVFLSVDEGHGKLIREKLYSLNNHFPNLNIADFGNIISSREKEAAEIIKKALDLGIIVVFLDCIPLSIIKEISPFSNVKWINSGIESNEELIHPDYIGFQRQLMPWGKLMQIEKSHPDSISLGLIRSEFTKLEPLLRKTQNLIVELSSLKSSCCPISLNNLPTGLTPEEICQICRYAGNSNDVRVVAFNLQTKQKSVNSSSEHLIIAHSLWYFLEGLSHRVIEDPSISEVGFNVFHVYLKDYEDELQFYQSISSGLYWFKIQDPGRSSQFIPCTHEDYIMCIKGELPERLFRYINMD